MGSGGRTSDEVQVFVCVSHRGRIGTGLMMFLVPKKVVLSDCGSCLRHKIYTPSYGLILLFRSTTHVVSVRIDTDLSRDFDNV